jgi:6-pyruvoyltetrahydropterin/6-carboxytetrahydropterin synthase
MRTARLIRRVRFAAAHRYRKPEWSDEKNLAMFGLCARPNYHGHTYTCAVTVEGPIDDATGMVIDLALVDRVLETEVVHRFDHRNINLDVPEFGEGRMIPTGENLARFIFDRVQSALGSVRVVSVQVDEDEMLSAVVNMGSESNQRGP